MMRLSGASRVLLPFGVLAAVVFIGIHEAMWLNPIRPIIEANREAAQLIIIAFLIVLDGWLFLQMAHKIKGQS